MSMRNHQPSLLNRIARVLLCLVFIHAFIGKLTGFAGPAAAIAAKGPPLAPLLLVAAMALMAVGSVLVISGWRSRLGAVLLLVFLVPTTLLFHGDVADPAERIQLLKNLSIIGGLLLVAEVAGRTAVTDPLAFVLLGARLVQSVIHLSSTSSTAVTLRFTAFTVQMAIAVYWCLGLLQAA